ncbi:MAG: DNA gyrase inhibitor YacG [Thermoguttaceae bacterium]|jgi:endogenous inhibitor of DNA gyrase (YacG/DUF329 family)|nr:DNA gyrase inhibitor YacG [Thermoguttaceae bacterium]
MRCLICDKEFSKNDPDAALPFCSPRCKMIDLKRWLGEEYSVESVNVDKLEEQIAGVDSEDDEPRQDLTT